MNRKRILILLGTALAFCIIVYVAFYFIFLDLLVELWWFRALDFSAYFWLRLLYRFIIPGGVALLFFFIFFSNFWFGSRFLGVEEDNPAEKASRKRKNLLEKFRTGAMDVYTVVSLILALMIATPFYLHWEEALLFFFAPASAASDPFYNNNISFYLFSLPVYELIQQVLLATFTLLFLSMSLLYTLEHRIQVKIGNELPKGARVHLTFLIMLVFLIVAWGFMLQRYGLLYIDSHEPVFYGPGFVDMIYDLPLIWTAMFTFLATAISLVVLIHSHGKRGFKALVLFGIIFITVVVLRQYDFIPRLLTKFYVQPNPVKAEKRYMSNNIKATLAAYKLNDVTTTDVKVTLKPEDDLAMWVTKEHLQSIPVWDRELLDDVYYQLQGLRPYYAFPSVDEDRYFLDGYLQQVNLAARELNLANLPKEAHSWENEHMRYTHGFGAVMTPAAQDGGRPIEWYLRDLNLTSSVGIQLDQPDIYYGLEENPYAIVPNELTIVNIAGTNPKEMENYKGEGGVPIPSLFRKMLFAFYFGDSNIFFSTNVNTKSKLLFHRNIIDRIKTLTPYLALDKDPYLVIADGKLYWIQDAYTLSERYPASKISAEKFAGFGNDDNQHFNYIRNSVKIIINAYDGSVDYYMFDPEDPIIQGYNRAYPGVFKSMDSIPPSLKKHLRYPRDLFYIQLKVYAKYHQREPELFYQQAETWQFAKTDEKEIKPYFLTTEFENCTEERKFVLITPMTPIGRDNLSVLAVAGPLSFEGCGNPSYSQKIAMFQFKKYVQVDGPAQMDALIDQDPIISESFTLWDQHGSKVTRGRMVILPVGKSVLYVQPVYMIATHTKIPELVRIIVGMGNEVVMEKSLAVAFKKLEDKLRKGHSKGIDMEGHLGLESDESKSGKVNRKP